MDVLTSAANAILSEDKENYLVLTPTKNSRPALGDLTNKEIVVCSPKKVSDSSFNALFREKIMCTNLSKSKTDLKTPGKRRKNSLKFGDENQAPSPKTPKNDIEKFHKFLESPVTPLSNLKMLTRIASMEERIPSKRNLFEVPEVVLKSKLSLRRCISESTSLLESKKQVAKPKLKRHPTSSDLDKTLFKINKNKSLGPTSESSRREKSLGLLCERFLDHFPLEVSCLETPRRLVIDDVASILGTERRRVYDIVNILECLNMASRVQKNMYQWMGKQHLETTLSKLKGLAEELGIGVHLSSPIEQSLRELKNGSTPGSLPVDKPDARKEKSIGILCQKFLMLFLTSPNPHIIHLDTAIHLLLGQEGDDLEKLRTRGRRIYDIANVLVSLYLIKKLPQCKSFMYIGPQVEATKHEEGVSEQSQIKLRHSLLPPLLMDSLHHKNAHNLSEDSMITPSDNDNPSIKKGRPRKLATEFVSSRAKRNFLVGRTKSEELQLGGLLSSDVTKYPSLQDICQVAEVEREKLLKDSKHVMKRPKQMQTLSTMTQNIDKRKTKTLLFSHFGSPRMALTFQNPSNFSPPSLTSKPPAPSPNVSRVVVRPPFILHKLNVSGVSRQQNERVNKKPVYVIQAAVNAPQNKSQIELNASSKGGFKVYSRKSKDLRTLSLPTVVKQTAASQVRVDLKTPDIKVQPEQQQQKGLTKSLSQTMLPNISLNTLSRNHYKTVFGSSSQIPNCSFSSPKEGSYHFVINTKDAEQQTTVPSDLKMLGKETRPPAFVKMFQKFSDDSSTDSELESIFGDSFNFTRPKYLLNKT